MKNNYFSSAYAAKAMLDIWIEDDKRSAGIDSIRAASVPNARKIIFINSAAAFLGLPGSIAYTRKFKFHKHLT
jgi:3-dehydrosphinganine reductase